MEPFLERLRAQLAGLPLPSRPARFAVALSGGIDSTVLLAALARLHPVATLRALHVDHGLHPSSSAWNDRCRQLAEARGVAYLARRITIAPRRGESLEALAREARYRALADMLDVGEVLLTAHHADDQLETVLLRLFRGSGVRGLRGIAECVEFGPGHLARPLLGFTRAEIAATAQAWELAWIEDPSNENLRFDRNFVRFRLAPEIARRWPAAARNVAQAAKQMSDAEEILAAVARADAAGAERAASSECTAITALSPARQRNLLRYLIGARALPLPSARQLESLRAALATDRPDARTCVRWPGAEARLYRGRLYLLRPLGAASGSGYRGTLAPDQPWHGPEGTLALEATAGPGLADAWVRDGIELRFRQGGERFRPVTAGPTRRLKRWLQEAAVLPWMRDRIPLLYHGQQLVAVGDLWTRQSADSQRDARRWRLRWTDHPPVQ